MSDDVNAEILGVVGSLLRQSDRTGADVWGWSQKGVGPKAYVERVMRRADVVFAIWEDDAAVGGYAFCVVSGSVAPAPKGGRRPRSVCPTAAALSTWRPISATAASPPRGNPGTSR